MAYEVTVTTPMKQCERISRSLGLLAGKCNVTTYNTTLVEITAITKYFVTGNVSGFTKGIIAVIPTGVSDNGHTFEWDYTTGAFKCYKPTAATTGSLTIIDSTGGTAVELVGGKLAATAASTTVSLTPMVAAAADEAADDTDCGEVGFIAIGFVR